MEGSANISFNLFATGIPDGEVGFSVLRHDGFDEHLSSLAVDFNILDGHPGSPSIADIPDGRLQTTPVEFHFDDLMTPQPTLLVWQRIASLVD